VLGSCPRIRGFRNLLLVQRATATHITVSACSWLVSRAASNPSRVGRNRGARWIMGHRPPLHAGPTRTSPLGSARGARRFLCFPGRERKENDGSVSTDSVALASPIRRMEQRQTGFLRRHGDVRRSRFDHHPSTQKKKKKRKENRRFRFTYCAAHGTDDASTVAGVPELRGRFDCKYSTCTLLFFSCAFVAAAACVGRIIRCAARRLFFITAQLKCPASDLTDSLLN
jgi:hypothetical protein